jgi:hypothetical protein
MQFMSQGRLQVSLHNVQRCDLSQLLFIHVSLYLHCSKSLRGTQPLDRHGMSHIQDRTIVGTDAGICSI